MPQAEICLSGTVGRDEVVRKRKGRPPTLQTGSVTKNFILQSHKMMVQLLVAPPSFKNKFFNAFELTGPGFGTQIWGCIYQSKLLEPS